MIARAFQSDRDEPFAGDPGRAGGGSSPRDGVQPKPLSRRVRGVVSVLLILHLVAIASAPLAMEPASLPAQKVFAVFRPYLDAAFLNHGYHFFAPEPGPSHLIRYELTFSDGRVENGILPDPAKQRPRLNYHRHFMLSEFANTLAVDDSQQSTLQTLSRSFARHLMNERQAESATLFLRRHYIPSPQQVQAGTELDADELYAERPLGTFSLAESAVVRLAGRLQLPGDLQAGEVTR
ncbi:MAG: hypothetical protein HQ518_19085 [Rhodopirellula sp.]|nr:hypothetical protein [Rhodopirellula sp.]